MGLQVVLNIQSQDDPVFDLAGLNQAIMGGYHGLGELYAEFAIGDLAEYNNDTYQGPFILDDQGQIKIACRHEDYFAQYDDKTDVWGCFDDTEAQRIASYLKSGRMVFRLDIEGNETQYFIIEPNKMTKKLQSQLSI